MILNLPLLLHQLSPRTAAWCCIRVSQAHEAKRGDLVSIYFTLNNPDHGLDSALDGTMEVALLT